MGILFPEWWLVNLIKKIEDVVMCCTLKVGNSDFHELVQKVKLMLQQMWILLFNIPISQVIEKRITWECEEGCDHREWSQDGHWVFSPNFLLFPDSEKVSEASWCPKSASQCSGFISSTSTGKSPFFLLSYFSYTNVVISCLIICSTGR